MEYMITANRPFAEIEAETVAALERRGVVVRRTFSLRVATGVASSDSGGTPGYSILMLYAPSGQPHPLGLVTLYERGGRTVIKPVLTSLASQDANAELVTALIMGGLDFCMVSTGGRKCLNEEGENFVQKETE